MENIGQTENELEASQLLECRQIVKNIVKFGVTDRQKIQIILLLGIELESRDAMNLIRNCVDEIKKMDENVKFSLTSEDRDYNDKKHTLLDV
jgi:CCR4-NOT transcriptional regulation complex NOT5 subunit